MGNLSTDHRVSVVPRGTLQIRIRFVRQRGNGGKPQYPLLPLKQTNKILRKFPSCRLIRNSILFGTLEYDIQKSLLKLHNQATSSLDISVMPCHQRSMKWRDASLLSKLETASATAKIKERKSALLPF